jgi:hypothetical protein
MAEPTSAPHQLTIVIVKQLRETGAVSGLLAPDPEPRDEEYFAEGRDESEVKVGILKNVRP